MQHLTDWLTNNKYFRECPNEIGCFYHYKKHIPLLKRGSYNNITVLFAHYSYDAPFDTDSDVLGTIRPFYLDMLRQRKCIFILDGTHEGWAPEHQSVAIALYNSAIKNNIDPSAIFFLSGNLREKANFKNFHLTHGDYYPINIIEIMHWDTFQKVMMTEGKRKFSRRQSLEQNYQGKFYLNLTRRNRFWRSYCTWKLHEADIAQYGLLSHDKLGPNEYRSNKFFSKEMEQTLTSVTPLIVDTTDFETNWAPHLGVELQNQVLFNLTSETMQSDWGETSLFYSEKTFKPIVCKTPVLIWGQTGQNYNLQRLGYKLYTDWFDYEFDFEPDIVKRWDKLEKEIVRVCTMLTKMTRSQQIDWSLKNEDLLDYNYKLADYNDYTISEFLRLIDSAQNYLGNQLIYDPTYSSKNTM